MRSRIASSRSLPLVLALAAVTCQRAAPGTETPAEDSTTTPARSATDDAAPTPAADPTHPLELVPARARAMLMVRSPQRAAEIWERERFAGRFPDAYQALVADMKASIGHDLLDPSALAQVGIDPTAPLGVAMLSVEDEAFMVFGGTGNPEALLELSRKVTNRPLPVEAVGEAQLVRVSEEVALVLRHGMFAFVLVDRHRSGGPDYAHEVARIDPAQSLAHATTMERAHAGLPQDADVRALLDVAGLTRDELEHARRREQEAMGEVSRRLAEARQRGSTPEELGRLQQDLQHEQEFVRRQQRERQVAELLLARTFGTVEGIGLAVGADGARGLLGRIHVALAPDAVLRELLVSSDEPPPVLRALDDAPQLVLSARVEPGVAIELLSQALLAAGGSYAELDEDVLRELRVDFDRAVRPQLDGRGTFVITTAPTPSRKAHEPLPEALGGLMAVGVTDEAKARALLDEVIGRHTELRFTRVPEIFGWTLARTEHPRALHFGVVAGQLVVGSDLAAIRRLRDAKVGQAGGRFADPEPWQRLTEGPGVGRLAMHHRLPVSLLFAVMGAFDDFDFPHDPDEQLASQLPEADVFSIPRSAATRRAEQERAKAEAAKQALLRKKRSEHLMAAWTKAEALGITAAVVREVDTGLVLEGGHYVPGGVFGYAAAIVELVEVSKGRDDPQIARARERVQELDAKVAKLRRRDVERAIAARQRQSDQR